MRTQSHTSQRRRARRLSLAFLVLFGVAAGLSLALVAARPAAAQEQPAPGASQTPGGQTPSALNNSNGGDRVVKNEQGKGGWPDEGSTGHTVLVAVGTALGVAALNLILNWLAKRNARRWVEPLEELRLAGVGPGGEPKVEMSDKIADPKIQARLREQLREVRGWSEHHFRVFRDFYRYYYMAIGTFSASALVAAVALFFITQFGVGKAMNEKPWVVAIFIVTTAAAALNKSFISVYRQAENIADNKQLYKNYIALENDLRSFCAIGEIEVDGKTTTAAGFITHVDDQLAAFNNIAVGFDATKVESYEGLFSALDRTNVKQAGDAGLTDEEKKKRELEAGEEEKEEDKPGGNEEGKQDDAGKPQDAEEPQEEPEEEPADPGAQDVQPKSFEELHAEYRGTPVLHLVCEGDTLEAISEQYSKTPEEITAANPDVDFSALQPGETVRIPGDPDEGDGDGDAGGDTGGDGDAGGDAGGDGKNS